MEIPSKIQAGIDVGSTTVKAVVIDNYNNILWKDYKRHNAKQSELVRDFLTDIKQKFSGSILTNYITGSGGRSIAPYINASYIQEVNAVIYAVESLYPDTGSVVELGGQDAKVIIWKKDKSGRKNTMTFMNDKCAGGTGATIDKILAKLGMTARQAGTLSFTEETPYHVAAKCGVFAETDVVGLLKSGADPYKIFLSLCNAIVKQNLEVLVKGNVLQDRVLLLGGPHTFLKAIPEIWRREIPATWQLHKWQPADAPLEELIYVPDDSQYFAAIGAVFFGKKKEELYASIHDEQKEPEHLFRGTAKLDEYIKSGRLKKISRHNSSRKGLVSSQAELKSFRKKYALPAFTEPDLKNNSVQECFLGIDGGSTSSKLVLLNRANKPFYKDYILSQGNPIIDVRKMLEKLHAHFQNRNIKLKIKASAVTGYAADILQKAFAIDKAVVETVAHMRAATFFYGQTDIICDVGGQDIKVLFMRHDKVVDFKLNTQCSAGNGYFLQSMAEQFNIPISQYAEHAFRAEKAPAFNYGCAVFMEQDKVNFQQLGWSKNEIMAGLALVLPLNIWNYVVQDTNISQFGNRIILQGGTQKNLAAVKAQVDYIKDRVPDAVVNVHRHADICGAVGAAIEVKEYHHIKKSSFPGFQEAAKVTFTVKNNATTRCRFCSNRCPRTFIDITTNSGEQIRHISGYNCEKGASETVDDMQSKRALRQNMQQKYPNLVKDAAREVFSYFSFTPLPEAGTPLRQLQLPPYKSFLENNLFKTRRFQRSSARAAGERAQIRLGIPRLLNNYLYTPFFSTYFRTLGIKNIIYSDYTSSSLWNAGNKWGAIDPCFPAKVAPAHIYNLLAKKNVTHICFPIITHLQSTVKNTLGNCACVIQMGTPEVVHAVFTREHDYFADYNVDYWKPLVRMDKPRELEGLLFEYFKDRLKITSHENSWAVWQGLQAQDYYRTSLQKRGKTILNRLVDEDKIGILVLGHPYHHDPGLNHEIQDQFQLRGFPIMCIESLPSDPVFLNILFGKEKMFDRDVYNIRDVWKRNFNRNTNLKIWAAKIAARHPNLAVIDYSSFKCGHDAPTYSYIDNILDASATPHFLFHDIDQNKPGATIKIRIQTIEYFLKLEEKKLKQKVAGL